MKYFILLNFLFFYGSSFGQYDIDFNLKNYENDTLIVGHYYADKQLVHDTLFSDKKGSFSMEGEDTLKLGVYFLLTVPDKNYIQFFVNGIDNEFEVNWNVQKSSDLKFKGSKDNEAFLKYIAFLGKQRPEADKYSQRIIKADSTGIEDIEAKEKLTEIEEKVEAYQLKLIAELPESITARFISSSRAVKVPEFEDTEDNQFAKYYFIKAHYFDNIDLGDPVNLRTPYIHNRIKYYMDKIAPKDPDSTIKSVDFILEKMIPSPDTYKYYLSYFLNQYAQMKIVGYDKVYVHLVDNYYAKGKAEWISEETLVKMKEQADNLRNILIGEKFPDITTYKKDSTAVRIWDVESPYTIVLFWAHDCGHCTKSMPEIVSFYDEFESKGVTLISICTKGGKKTVPCQEAIPEKKMDKFINTFDVYQRYRNKVYIRSTPKIFILDNDKNILIKDIPAKELKNVMKEIIKMDDTTTRS
ncbi:MAG: redoxin domain-containing protein [Saprospiraceae bacterium]|nr:redoxin domain-containing protein [Saprospiraceae bacterium]